MKKALALVLTIAMVMSFAVTAFAAVPSPKATVEDLTPVATVESEDYTVVSAEKVAEMPEEAQKTFAEAKKELAAAAPAGMAVKYFFYFSAKEGVTAATNATFTLKNVANATVMQFVDGKWVEVEAELDANGNLVVKGLVDGPVAIFTK